MAERATIPGESIDDEPFAVDADTVFDALRAADVIGAQFRRSA